MKTKLGLIAFLFLLGMPRAFGAVAGQNVEYADGDAVLQGYLAYDDAIEGPRPAVMVVPEWHGLNDYSKRRAEQLAKLGYTGFAVDMYGKGIRPETHEEAAKFSGIYFGDRLKMRARAKAAYDFLLKQTVVDPQRVAAIGYCFGGTTVLEMARAGMPLTGVASFHGNLSTPLAAKAGEIHVPVRVYHGDEDRFTGPGLEGFRKEMREAGAPDWQVIIFSGAVHSFTVPESGNDKSKGIAYNERADKESWADLVRFLKQVLG